MCVQEQAFNQTISVSLIPSPSLPPEPSLHTTTNQRLKTEGLGRREALSQGSVTYLLCHLVLNVTLDPAQHEGFEDHVQSGELLLVKG